jgi:HTH-type transcriptional regulator / antitoxin HigA
MTKQKKNARRKTKPLIKGRMVIRSKEAYEITMKEVDTLMKKGEANMDQKELDRLGVLAEAAEAYEDKHDPLPLAETLPEMIRIRIYQMQLTQSFAARLLGVSDAKFSLIMNGKQKPDIYFIKAIHEKLKMDANVILKAL